MTAVSTFTMKLVRADEHLEALNNEVANFLAIGPYEVVTQQNGPRGVSPGVVVPGRLFPCATPGNQAAPQQPNAGAHLLPEAGARYERTL